MQNLRMIVFNLSCSQRHSFDGWFRSADDFERQLRHGLVECPVCNDRKITKQLCAPRLNIGAVSQEGSQESSPKSPTDSFDVREVIAITMIPGLQQHMLQQFKAFVLAHTENVGMTFAETARRMYYGEESQRNIRGRISPEEAMALREEGIETVSLPVGILLDEGLQ